ncbi:2Fe-2S iron-sulfur cluster-binding protein [Rhizorhabdus sp.]|jgi:2Fe-2S ferredoxin|uniref:2Fe-2S iron-sulfur cluster-binding protein n=1 Tax=Rhizorhabdus sp. TaxID=1968843 RepID=UPI0019CD558A|nr:2Fe-2S iron-sulfur cluster-binding protein [Rhizorhabdus sp.]MBD3759604.1 2Fe-2S iron-sulfur cluster binding domain-containing protein [Rhizorhabdus sp.]
MVTVTVKPSGISFTGEPGQTMMAAANAANIYWPTLCGGEGRCLLCMVSVDEAGNAALEPPEEHESQTLTRVGRSVAAFRLGCAAKLTGQDVTVTHRKVRPATENDRLPFA